MAALRLAPLLVLLGEAAGTSPPPPGRLANDYWMPPPPMPSPPPPFKRKEESYPPLLPPSPPAEGVPSPPPQMNLTRGDPLLALAAEPDTDNITATNISVNISVPHDMTTEANLSHRLQLIAGVVARAAAANPRAAMGTVSLLGGACG